MNNEYLSLIFRCILFYIIIIIALRIMGKREIGELSVLDVVIYFVMSEVFAMSISNEDPLYKALLAIVVLVLIQVIVSVVCLKSKKSRDFFEGNPVIIIENGIINQNTMKKQRYTIDDLYFQLRDKGVGNIEAVKFAVLENSGVLTVLLKSECELKYPIPLVSDGQVEYGALKKVNKDISWLVNELSKMNVNDVHDVFICIYQKDGLYVVMKDHTTV